MKTLVLLALAGSAAASGKLPPHEREWDFVARQIDQWTFTEDLTVIVGNATDILWTHSKGRITPHTVVETESTSKWPMAMALAGVAADGSFGEKGLDTLASDHLEVRILGSVVGSAGGWVGGGCHLRRVWGAGCAGAMRRRWLRTAARQFFGLWSPCRGRRHRCF